jgi:hypothetical protein
LQKVKWRGTGRAELGQVGRDWITKNQVRHVKGTGWYPDGSGNPECPLKAHVLKARAAASGAVVCVCVCVCVCV